MDIKEVKEYKETLQKGLLRLIADFEKTTKMSIESVDLEKSYTVGFASNSNTTGVLLKVTF